MSGKQESSAFIYTPWVVRHGGEIVGFIKRSAYDRRMCARALRVGGAVTI
jgi:hypothetical protein